nr:MAG TPA: hypothetical protein [Caudoviricetes sp.]
MFVNEKFTRLSNLDDCTKLISLVCVFLLKG